MATKTEENYEFWHERGDDCFQAQPTPIEREHMDRMDFNQRMFDGKATKSTRAFLSELVDNVIPAALENTPPGDSMLLPGPKDLRIDGNELLSDIFHWWYDQEEACAQAGLITQEILNASEGDRNPARVRFHRDPSTGKIDGTSISVDV